MTDVLCPQQQRRRGDHARAIDGLGEEFLGWGKRKSENFIGSGAHSSVLANASSSLFV